MNKVTTIAAAVLALAAVCAWGEWVYEGKWGSEGSGNGQFDNPGGIAVATNGNVYVADTNNYRIQYFTSTGSFLGKWGKNGTGNGEFQLTKDVAFTSDGARCYVTDGDNHRVQYFKDTEHAVEPESLGKVKALFR